MANSADPDQMLHSVLSNLGLQCLLRPGCLNTLGKMAPMQGCYVIKDGDKLMHWYRHNLPIKNVFLSYSKGPDQTVHVCNLIRSCYLLTDTVEHINRGPRQRP